MERLETLDEESLTAVLQAGVLDLDNPGTEEDVSNAIDSALRLASSAQQEDATQQQNNQPTNEAAPAPAADPAWVSADERKEILAVLDAMADRRNDDPDDDEGNLDMEKACLLCLSTKEPQIKLACGHRWCKKCLCHSVAEGMRPGSGSWPPKCCGPHTEETIAWLQMPEVVRMWRQVREERETPASELVYCARPACGEFIPQRSGREDDAKCLACGENTCRSCRCASHPGRPCTLEAEDEMLMDLMDQKGWVNCPQCSLIVDLIDGCNHVKCRCGFDWCFICGESYLHGHRCPQYGHQHMRQPARERRHRFRQGRPGDERHTNMPSGPEIRDRIALARPNLLWQPLDNANHPPMPAMPAAGEQPGNRRLAAGAPNDPNFEDIVEPDENNIARFVWRGPGRRPEIVPQSPPPRPQPREARLHPLHGFRPPPLDQMQRPRPQAPTSFERSRDHRRLDDILQEGPHRAEHNAPVVDPWGNPWAIRPPFLFPGVVPGGGMRQPPPPADTTHNTNGRANNVVAPGGPQPPARDAGAEVDVEPVVFFHEMVAAMGMERVEDANEDEGRPH